MKITNNFGLKKQFYFSCRIKVYYNYFLLFFRKLLFKASPIAHIIAFMKNMEIAAVTIIKIILLIEFSKIFKKLAITNPRHS